MDTFELFERLGLAMAIGAIVGVERHWWERGEEPGQRAAGIRTFTMCGMFGGFSAAIEIFLSKSQNLHGTVITGFFIVFSLIFAAFDLREIASSHKFSVTSVIAAMMTFSLGVMAFVGDKDFAVAGGVSLVSLLASRHFLHAFMRSLTWNELRSAIIFLAMAFVVLPVLPVRPIYAFGGLSLSQIWMIIVLLSGISFLGYVALKLFGETKGLLITGCIGGLVSSTAVTLTNTHLSRTQNAPRTLIAGAFLANSTSCLKVIPLSMFVAGPVALRLAPPLIITASAMAFCGVWMSRQSENNRAVPMSKNPFELTQILKLASLITVVMIAARLANSWFGESGLMVVSMLSGFIDVDAVIVSLAGLSPQITPEAAATSLWVAVIANIIAKTGFAAVLGSSAFSIPFLLGNSIAAALGTMVFFVTPH